MNGGGQDVLRQLQNGETIADDRDRKGPYWLDSHQSVDPEIVAVLLAQGLIERGELMCGYRYTIRRAN